MLTQDDNKMLKQALLERVAQSGQPYSAGLARDLAEDFVLINLMTKKD